MKRCIFIKINNEKCEAFALKNEQYCFFHSETTAVARKEAINKGGISKKRNYGSDESLKLSSAEDILKLLEHTANDLRANKMNSNTANALNLIAGTAIKTIELRQFELKHKPTIYNKISDDIQNELMKMTGL